MPKQPPAPKRAPAIPLGGPMGRAFPGVPSLPARARTPSVAPATSEPAATDTRTSVSDQARADLITRYWFYAFMVLDVLGLAAVGYAMMMM